MPKNNLVLDSKPKNNLVLDSKPKMNNINGETVVYTDAYSYVAGQPMGLLLALTYPVGFSGVRNRL